MEKVRVRIAPSPTGNLHVGTARSALFNWLFARKHGGTFLVRIEDTHAERSSPAFEKNILEGLTWLNLKSDEDIVRQSEYFHKYQKYAVGLVKKGAAYKEPGKTGSGEAIILHYPQEDITFSDLIRGPITFAAKEMKDPVLMKSDGSPSYNFSVVVDDHEMEISHVIRGDDLISSTTTQIAIYRALEWNVPEFAHIPLILAPDKSKLSKRHGAVAVTDYRREGYLPEAMTNFLALLGWNPGTSQEIFARDELIQAFDLAKIHKGGAVFDQEKLNWFNREYIKRLSDDDLKKELRLYLAEVFPEVSQKYIEGKFISLIRPRITTLKDAVGELEWFKTPNYRAPLLAWKSTPADTLRQNLEAAREVLEKLPDAKYTPSELENALMPVADARGRGETLWPLRVALSGAEKSPSPFELLALLGKAESMARISVGLRKLGAPSTS